MVIAWSIQSSQVPLIVFPTGQKDTIGQNAQLLHSALHAQLKTHIKNILFLLVTNETDIPDSFLS